MIMKIRKAVESDIDQVEKLYHELCDYLAVHGNYPGWKKGIYPSREDAKRGWCENALFVAVNENKIVATFILRHEPEEGYKNVKWLTPDDYSKIYVLYTLAVDPNHLMSCIGTKILKFIEDLAKTEGCISLRFDVVKGNFPAESLYQKSGFQFIDTVSLGYEEYGLPWYNL